MPSFRRHLERHRTDRIGWLCLFYSLNPMVGIIEGFRWALLGTTRTLDVWSIVFSTGFTLILLVSGLFYFKSSERLFADLI